MWKSSTAVQNIFVLVYLRAACFCDLIPCDRWRRGGVVVSAHSTILDRHNKAYSVFFLFCVSVHHSIRLNKTPT